MKRREFIRNSGYLMSVPFWLEGCLPREPANYPVSVHSDYRVGHLMMESISWPTQKSENIETAIIGGGLAGLAAAFPLREQNFTLFELSDRIGGTAAAYNYNGIQFCQGAHYELEYPEYYGEEVIRLLEDIGIIEFQAWKKTWAFKEAEHIIPYFRRQQCFEDGIKRGDVIEESPTKTKFLEILSPYLGKMPLPSRLIPEDIRYLNDISFFDFLSERMEVTPSFKRLVDYHMFDDYGGASDQVSAVAGIHYFMCRPYYNQAVELFSPPNGNDYFSTKILNTLSPGSIKLNHLVRKIEKSGDGFLLEIIDVPRKIVKKVGAEKVVYAGQKHALKYVYPEQFELWSNTYAPWMVVNIITRQSKGDYGFWQNEFLGDNPSFIGFIDSSVQRQIGLNGYRVFSGYYCLKPDDREYLVTIDTHKERIAKETQNYIEQMLGRSIHAEAAFINVMGHAMAIPKPGFLFNDANEDSRASMVYAGVDNARLPLLYEALDSGLLAAARV